MQYTSVGQNKPLETFDSFLGHPKFLEQFEYSDIDIADAMTSCMGNQSFIGISGHVQFGEYGDSIKKLRLDQIQGIDAHDS